MLTLFVKTRNLPLTSIEKRLLYQLKSFTPETYEIGLIKLLLFPYFSLFSDFIKFHHEIDKWKNSFYKNSYPRDLFDKYIKEFLDKILAPKSVLSTMPKTD